MSVTNKNAPVEYLLRNFIDEEFQAVLRPLTIFQSFYLIAKFRILNNFITPKNNIFTSVIGAIIMICAHVLRFVFFYKAVESFESAITTYLLYFDLVFYSTVSGITYIVYSFHSDNIVQLVIQLQRVLNLINIDKTRFLLKLMMENWLSVGSVVVVNILFYFQVLVTEFGLFTSMGYLAITIAMLFFDLNIINATRTVVFIKNELIAWNHVMKKNIKVNIKTEEEQNNEVSKNDMFKAYVYIVKAFRLSNKVYQFAFIYVVFQTFIQILGNLEMVLEFRREGDNEGYKTFPSILMKVLTLGWNLKDFILLTTLSIACENFHGTVKAAECYCAQILSKKKANGMRKTCKNVLRLNRAALLRLSAFGVFELDAAFPLRLLAGLVPYTVVLLQFAFL